MSSNDGATTRLLDEALRALFTANPEQARAAGDHSFDGVLPDVGHDAGMRRIADLEELRSRLEAVDLAGADPDAVADVRTAQQLAASEHFHLARLREAETSPMWAPYRGADVWSYVARDYAPRAERAEAVCRHLEQLPEWLDAAAAMLEPSLAAGPREVALDVTRGFASFYRDDLRTALGELADASLAARLDRALEAGANACDRHATRLEAAATREDVALGEATFCAMLEAQEGIVETAAALRRRVDAELLDLEARGAEVAARIGAPSLVAAFHEMERSRPTAATLVSTAAGMLDELRRFWLERDVVTVPTDVDCRVVPSPSFLSWITAAYENPGPLDPPGLDHFYFVTPVDSAWAAEKAEQWLTHLNLPCLENISVHEVYPGHFVHCVAALRQPSLTRKVSFFSGFGEGWAHYTEQLAIEQGLAEGRPLLELAMLQDALLRACRFSAGVGMHCEGQTVAEATEHFEEHAHVPRMAAEREALRGTYDPTYLVYTYGKLEILRWREELSRRPGYTLKKFHDRLLACGHAPLATVREYADVAF